MGWYQLFWSSFPKRWGAPPNSRNKLSVQDKHWASWVSSTMLNKTHPYKFPWLQTPGKASPTLRAPRNQGVSLKPSRNSGHRSARAVLDPGNCSKQTGRGRRKCGKHKENCLWEGKVSDGRDGSASRPVHTFQKHFAYCVLSRNKITVPFNISLSGQRGTGEVSPGKIKQNISVTQHDSGPENLTFQWKIEDLFLHRWQD